MSKYLSRVLMTVCILMLSSFAWPEESVVINIDENNEPYMYGAQGKAAGLYPLIIQEAFRRIGVSVTIRPIPWKRALKAADETSDGIGGAYSTSERRMKWDFSEPLFTESLVLYARKGDLFRYQDLASLTGKRVGVHGGWSYGDNFDGARRKGLFQVEDVATDAQNMEKLVLGHVDVVVVNYENASFYVRTHRLEKDLERVPGTFLTLSTHIAFSKKQNRAGLLSRFNGALRKMRQDKSYDALLQKGFAR